MTFPFRLYLDWWRKPIISSWNLHFCCFLMCETRSDMVRNYCRISRSALPRTGRSTASSMTLSGQIGGCMKLWCVFFKMRNPKIIQHWSFLVGKTVVYFGVPKLREAPSWSPRMEYSSPSWRQAAWKLGMQPATHGFLPPGKSISWWRLGIHPFPETLVFVRNSSFSILQKIRCCRLKALSWKSSGYKKLAS